MAKSATIYKAVLNLSDTDRHYYAEHKVTIALHPSETLDRMMVRVLAFCLHASDTLQFTRGLSSADEPALWDKALSGQILTWIDVGQPSFERIKKSRGLTQQLILYSFGRGCETWWTSIQSSFLTIKNLTVKHLSDSDVAQLATLAEKNMHLTVCITDGVIYINSGDKNITLEPKG